MDILFDDIWERVKTVTGWKTQAELATNLGIKQSSVSGAKQRGTFPAEWIIKITYDYKVSCTWLLTGEGPMHRTESKLNPSLLESVMVEAEQQLAAQKITLSLTRKAALVAFVYDQHPEDVASCVEKALRLMTEV